LLALRLIAVFCELVIPTYFGFIFVAVVVVVVVVSAAVVVVDNLSFVAGFFVAPVSSFSLLL